MTLITKSSTRLAALVAGVAVALALMGAVAVAPAQAAGLSSSQIQAIVSLLASFGADSATIANVTAALNGQATPGSGSSNGGVCPVLTRSLQQGSSGADVKSLQIFLNASADTRVSVSGAGSPGMETTFFGPATHAAVVKFQAKNNVSPIGVVGPATRAAIAAVCGTVVTPGPVTPGPTSPLQGGEGQLNEIDNISNDVEDEVDEGSEENVFGAEITAEDSDLMIERVDVIFTAADATSGGDSEDLDDYITEVAIVLDGKVLATMDVDEADEDDGSSLDDLTQNSNDVFSFRFSGLKGIIREDDTADLYVRVTAVNNVDSSETDVDWHVTIPEDGIRAVDAAGISDTYVGSSDLTEEVFNVVEPDAGDLDLSASGADNEDRIISVSADNDTNGEEVMIFTLESNTGDNNVSDIRVNFSTTTATTTSFTSVINRVHLYQGSTKLGSEDISATSTGGGTVTFDNLDIDIDEDEEVEFRVEADFNDEADEREGFTFYAYIQGSGIEAEDGEGDNVSVSGTVSGGDIELRTSGIMAAFKSADEVRTNGTIAGDADAVDFTIKFSVTAVGDEDIYLDGDIVQGVNATGGLAWATTTDSSTGTSTYTGILTADNGYQNGEDTNIAADKRFLIEGGETRNFTFKVNIPAGTDNSAVGVRIVTLKWDTVDQDAMSNTYNFNMSDWTTDTVTGLYIR